MTPIDTFRSRRSSSGEVEEPTLPEEPSEPSVPVVVDPTIVRPVIEEEDPTAE